MQLPTEIRGTAGDFVEALTRKNRWGYTALGEINVSGEVPLTAEEVGRAILYAVDKLVEEIANDPGYYVWGARPVVSLKLVNEALEFIREQKAQATNTVEE